jgi:hypothetical protein
MHTLSSTTLRTALVDYRAGILRLAAKYPQTYAGNVDKLQEIDNVLLSMEGNVTTVAVLPHTCNPNV